MKHLNWIIAVSLLLGVSAGWCEEATGLPEVIRGEVLEVQDVPNYTYMRLKTASGEVWTAVATAKVAVGAAVTVEDAQMMDDFESKALKKTFKQIYFGSLPAVALSDPADKARVAAAHAEAAKARAAGAHVEAPKLAQADDGPVSKASGADARTVAEIVTSSADFKDTSVTLRARVVKYSAGIMAKNWLHVRDGSGSGADASNDLLVTTQEPARIGEVLLIKGMVRKNRDFGAGYAYKVMVEEATLQR